MRSRTSPRAVATGAAARFGSMLVAVLYYILWLVVTANTVIRPRLPASHAGPIGRVAVGGIARGASVTPPRPRVKAPPVTSASSRGN